jgi:SH3-like domain-containing protein
MKKRILLLVVTVVVLSLVYSTTLAAESIPTRFIEITGNIVNIRTGPSTSTTIVAQFIEITGNIVNIRTGPSTSTTIVAQAKKGDIFELKGEINGWYKINMFSGEYRYIHKSLAKLTTYTISLPSSASIRQKIFSLIGEAEDRAMDEADQKYPMNISNNIDQNIDYERLLIDKYKLTIFHEFKVQPVIYRELIVEVIKEQQRKKETKPTTGEYSIGYKLCVIDGDYESPKMLLRGNQYCRYVCCSSKDFKRKVW